MKVALVLLLAASPALACDWAITSDRIDPMTDQRTCIIRSPTAKIALGVRGDVVTFVTTSAYNHRDALQIRVDDGAPILLGRNARSTDSFESDARDAPAAIRAGSRIRTSYRDYPSHQEGDAAICTLPALIDSCSSHPSR